MKNGSVYFDVTSMQRTMTMEIKRSVLDALLEQQEI